MLSFQGKRLRISLRLLFIDTYWYHSHQDSVNQLDKGLYGSLIDSYDQDYTLVLDEWMSPGSMGMKTNTSDSSQKNKSMEGTP
ncbi:hypothetical protein [Brevibacillus sp. SKDU10]|uniref:hypothetical protein n=1 Tax=Brevibacillus sp. SKDU10 TaxID=1247872 RepID=UPI00350EC168